MIDLAYISVEKASTLKKDKLENLSMNAKKKVNFNKNKAHSVEFESLSFN